LRQGLVAIIDAQYGVSKVEAPALVGSGSTPLGVLAIGGGEMRNFINRPWCKAAALALFAAGAAVPTQAVAWEPTRTVEFVVPAGTGGGADQMARIIQGLIAKNKLMKEPKVVINQSGGAGSEGV